MISSKVEALLFVANRRLVPMHLPTIGYNLISDPNEDTIVVAGPIATSDPTYKFIHGADLPHTLFVDDEHPTRPFPRIIDDEHVLFRVPFCVPKLTGVSLLEGSITDPTLMSALKSYHEFTAKWLNFHTMIAKDGAIVISSPTVQDLEAMIEDNLLPPNPLEVPISTYSNMTINMLIDGASDSSSLRYSIDLAIEMRKNTLVSVSITEPDTAVQTRPPPLFTPLVHQPSTKQANSFLFQGVQIPNKYMRAIRTFQAMLVSTHNNSPMLPTLRKEFLQCFSQSSQ